MLSAPAAASTPSSTSWCITRVRAGRLNCSRAQRWVWPLQSAVTGVLEVLQRLLRKNPDLADVPVVFQKSEYPAALSA